MGKILYKQRFLQGVPNKKMKISTNVGYLKYIAQRPGTDKSVPVNKEFSSYSDFIEKNHGLFGSRENEDLEKRIQELKTHKGIVWRSIVSMKEEDALSVGYTDKDKWVDMMNKEIFIIAEKMNISATNLEWVAAYHNKPGQPHVHLMYWEKEPRLLRGLIPSEKLKEINKALTDHAFGEKRDYLIEEKNQIRNQYVSEAIDVVSNFLQKANSYSEFLGHYNKSINEISRVYSDDELFEIKELMQELAEHLPTTGRKAYGYMPPAVKEKVEKIADEMMKLDSFDILSDKNKETIKELVSLYETDPEKIETAQLRAEEQLKRRMYQIIIKGAYSYRDFNGFKVSNKKLNKAAEAFKQNATIFNYKKMEDRKVLKVAERALSIGIGKERIEDYIAQEGCDIPGEDFFERFNENESFPNSGLSKKMIIQNYQCLKMMGITSSEANEILKTLANREVAVLKEVSGDGLDIGYHIDLSEDDFYLLNEIDRNIEGIIDIKKLLEDARIKDSLRPSMKKFEYISIDKKIASMFKKNEGILNQEAIVNLIGEDIEGKNKISIQEGENSLYEEFNITYDMVNQRLKTLLYHDKIRVDDSDSYYMTGKRIDEIKGTIRPFTFGRYDAEVTCGYFSDGALKLDDIANVFSTDEMEKEKIKSLKWRLNKLTELEILKFNEDHYKITEKGHRERERILNPKIEILEKKIKFYEKIGLIKNGVVTDAFYKKREEGEDKKEKINRAEREYIKLVAEFEGNIDYQVVKQKKNFLINKVLHENKEELGQDYNVGSGYKNDFKKSVEIISTIFLMNNKGNEEIAKMIYNFSDCEKTDRASIEEIIRGVEDKIKDDIKYGKISYFTKNQFEEAFDYFGINNPPPYIFEGDKSFNISGMLQGIERELKKDQAENQIELDRLNKIIERAEKKKEKER